MRVLVLKIFKPLTLDIDGKITLDEYSLERKV